jgi:hypothetical protein
MIAYILPFLLASTPLPAEDVAAVEARVSEIFQPYKAEANDAAAWELPVFSRETKALIGHWQRVMPEGEVDELNDGDWFCQCQDWDQQKFSVTSGLPSTLSEGLVEVEARVDLGFDGEGGIRTLRLIFRREGKGWMLDDMFADSFPDGLKQALRETIVADEARRASAAKSPK